MPVGIYRQQRATGDSVVTAYTYDALGIGDRYRSQVRNTARNAQRR